jgi:hypothetical protein
LALGASVSLASGIACHVYGSFSLCRLVAPAEGWLPGNMFMYVMGIEEEWRGGMLREVQEIAVKHPSALRH